MGKGGDDDKAGDKLLDNEDDGEESVKNLIAQYAGGSNGNGVDAAYALQVLKELGEAESTPECSICFGEVSDEVLLPCFHRG
jgi:DNA repair protein RAD5